MNGRIKGKGRLSTGDWFCKTSWSRRDAEEFERNLARARGQRVQYIKMQAQALAETGRSRLADPAIALARRCLQEDVQGFFEIDAYMVIAEASQTKGDKAGALEAYRSAVRAERPTLRRDAHLDLAWFVVTHRMKKSFDEALGVMESLNPDDFVLPIFQYKFFAILALISDTAGDKKHASRMARNALEAASGPGPFPRHPQVGLVEGINEQVQQRIRRLADRTR